MAAEPKDEGEQEDLTTTQACAVEDLVEPRPAVEDLVEPRPAVEDLVEPRPAVEDLVEPRPADEDLVEPCPADELTMTQVCALEDAVEAPLEAAAHPDDKQRLEGRLVGGHVVGALLGRGDLGRVYGAAPVGGGPDAALRVLSPRLLRDRAARERVIAGVRSMQRIEHPGVAAILELGRLEDERLYYLTEALSGGDLSTVLKAGALPAGEALPYVEQLCGALQAAHHRGVLHLALRPETIYRADPAGPTLKLLDLGLTQFIEGPRMSSITDAGVILGRPVVTSPEQAAGRADQLSARTDLYCLGVLLYWMLAGRPPFDSDLAVLLLAQHIEEAPPPLEVLAPATPPGIVEIVTRCLAKDPADRPESAGEIAQTFVVGLTTGRD